MVAEALRRAGFPRMTARLSRAAPDGEDTFAELGGDVRSSASEMPPVIDLWNPLSVWGYPLFRV